MFRSRSWFGGPWGGRPKNRLSLEHLKYLYSILEKNTTVSESNRGLLVESLRCIAEILIWGDQHDSLVFEWVSGLQNYTTEAKSFSLPASFWRRTCFPTSCT